ncbi:MAG: CHAT domain-containing protein [Bacteroidetes bacterium]|nr:CHAT domain-containing protein [Bacteroidota bacterium]
MRMLIRMVLSASFVALAMSAGFAQTIDTTGIFALPGPVYDGAYISTADSLAVLREERLADSLLPEKPDSGMALLKDALTRARAAIRGQDHVHIAALTYLIGFVYHQLDSMAAAAPYLEEYMRQARRTFCGRDHPAIAGALQLLAETRSCCDRFAEAEELLNQAIAMLRRLYSRDNVTLARCLDRLGRVYEVTARPQQAESLLVEALGMSRRIFSSDHEELAISINSLGQFLNNSGRAQEAEPLLAEAVAMYMRLFPEGTLDLAGSIMELAKCRHTLARFDEADTLFGRALAMFRSVDHDETEELAKSIGTYAQFQMARGQYAVAESLQMESVAMSRRLARGRDNKALACNLENHAALLGSLGRHEEALRYYDTAIAMLRRLSAGSDSRELSLCMSSMGSVYEQLGRHVEAERLLLDALAMQRRLHSGVDHPDLAQILVHVGIFHGDRGRHDEADTSLSQAVAMYRRLCNGHDSPDLAVALMNLVTARIGALHMRGVLALCEEGLAMSRRLYGAQSTMQLAFAVHDAAYCNMVFGCFAEADRLFAEALSLYTRLASGRDTPGLAECLQQMGMLRSIEVLNAEIHEAKGHYQEALQFCRMALAMRRRLYPDCRHRDLAFSINDMMTMHALLGNIDSAAYYCREFITCSNRQREYSEAFETEYEQETAAEQWRFANESTITFCLNHARERPDLAADVAGIAIANKCRALAGVSTRRRIIAGLLSTDATIRDLWTQINACEERIAELFEENALDSALRAKRRAESVSLNAALEAASKEMERLIAGRPHADVAADARQVQNLLRPDEAAVEFIRYRYYDGRYGGDSTMYCAAVLRGGGPAPGLVWLCNQPDIAKILGHEVGEWTSDCRSYIHDAGSCADLYDLVWRPVDSLLHGVRRVYISPDGLLNRVTFGLVQDSTGRRLQDRYELHYLTSSRDLTREQDSAPARGRPVAFLIGNPDFAVDSAALAIARGMEPSQLLGDTGVARSALPESDLHGVRSAQIGIRLSPLSATKAELSEVALVLRSHGYAVHLLDSVHATEEAFGRVQSPAVLHIATHGFTLDAPRRELDSGGSMVLRGGAYRMQDVNYPYLRTGILLAGADHAWTGHQPYTGIRDGIVTAFDISHMDFTGTELVVLSSCESGLGDILAGEGVFGLARAFRAAGARAVMMSLWKVPDKQTQELMELFYTNWLDKHMSKPEALREAQREMAGRYNDPYYWGAFVLVGA